MKKVAKVAISLPRDVLEIVERERKAKGESRSEFFRRAVEEIQRQQRQRTAVEQYIRGYQQMPEIDEEVQAVHRIGALVLAEETWD